METKNLVGMFVQGTLKGSGAEFMGVVDSFDDDFLYLTLNKSKKVISISAIGEMKVEEYKERID